MDEVQIVTYSAENHSVVRRLFSNGMLEHRKAAVFVGLSSTKLQASLLSVFLLGYFCHSTWLGIGSMFIVMVLQAYMVYWWFNTYVRYVHLFCTIMKDIFEIIYLKYSYRYADINTFCTYFLVLCNVFPKCRSKASFHKFSNE